MKRLSIRVKLKARQGWTDVAQNFGPEPVEIRAIVSRSGEIHVTVNGTHWDFTMRHRIVHVFELPAGARLEMENRSDAPAKVWLR